MIKVDNNGDGFELRSTYSISYSLLLRGLCVMQAASAGRPNQLGVLEH